MATGLRARMTAIIAAVAVVFSGLTAAAPASAALPLPTPAAPTSLVVTTAYQGANLTWNAPTNTGTSPISSYTVQWSTTSTFTSVLGSQTSATNASAITGLANATAYYVRVAGANTSGLGAWTSAVKFTTSTTPAAPAGVTVTGGVGTATFNWFAPMSAGTPVTGYTVQYSRDLTLATGVTTVELDGSTRSYTAPDLLAGTKYGVRVRATNAVGNSAFSAIVTGTTASVAPAPTGLKVVPSTEQIAISWARPTSTGGSPITGYRIQYTTDATFVTNIQTVNVDGAATLTYALTGLPNGAKYYVRVASVNGVGAGLNTTPVNATTFNLPLAPTSVLVKGTAKGSLTVTWKAPSNIGGTPITGYTVQYSKSATFENVEGTSTVAGNILTTVVTGLDNGTRYYVRISATNLVGSGALATYSALTFATSSAPQSPVVKANARGALNITWKAPSALGGSVVTGYIVEYSTTATFESVEGSSIVAGNILTKTFTGLSDATTYYFRVQATNAVDTSPKSVTASAATYSTPKNPLAPTLAPGLQQIVAKWAAPANGGSTITGYRVQWSTTADFASLEGAVDVAGLTYTIPALAIGGTYYVRVSALNIVGAGNASPATASTTLAPPSAPRNVSVVGGPSRFSSAWAAPLSTGGSAITGYTVQYSTSETFDTNVQTLTAKTLSAAVASLPASTTYYVRVSATNIVGTGTPSATQTVVTFGAPSAPNLTVTATGATSATVTWPTPVLNGSILSGYTLQYSTNPDFTGATSVPVRTATGLLPVMYSVSALIPGATYYFRVQALSLAGNSSYSTTKTVALWSAPSIPTDLTVTPGAGTATLNWVAPTNAGSHPVVGYRILFSSNPNFTGATAVDTTSADTTRMFTLLAPGTTYYAKVAARSTAGISAYTEPANATTWTAPNAVTEATATWTSATTANVTWTAPASAGGSPISGYRVQYSTTALFNVNTVVTIDTVNQSLNLVNLVSGTRYFVRVAAMNAVGLSAQTIAQNDLAALRPATPNEPAVTVKSPTSLTATWTAPADNGCGITAYAVQIDDNAEFTSPTTTSLTGTTTDFSDLETGTRYYVRIQAANPCGTSGYSTTGSNVPLDVPAGATIPATPAAPYASTLTTTSAQVTWTAPTDGGAQITNYLIQYSTDNGATWTTYEHPTSTETSLTLTGLTEGSTYLFRVAADNIVGYSNFSVAGPDSNNYDTTSHTFTDVDGDSSSATWNSYNSSLYTWSENGINYYAYSPADKTWWSNELTDLTSAPVTNTDGTRSYTPTATGAFNARSVIVERPFLTSSGLLMAAKPGATPAPTVELTSGNTAMVTWNAAVNNGSPITGYTVIYSTSSDFTTGTQYGTSTSATSYEVTDLSIGATYYFKVIARNAVGSSTSAATMVVTAAAPSAPAAPTATMSSTTSVALSWTAPADNGAAIADYTIEYSNDNGATWTAFVDGVSTETNATVTGLSIGSTYQFRVSATNSVGTSAQGAQSAPALLATAPATPAAVTFDTPTTSSVNVSWTSPDSNGATITSFDLQYSTDVTFGGGVTLVAGLTTPNYSAAGLNTDAVYYFRVRATNAAGTGSYSSVSYLSAGAIHIATAPSAPTGVTAVSSSTAAGVINVSWNAPLDNGGSQISLYIIQTSLDGLTYTDASTSNTTSGSVNVDAGTVAYVRVIARNSVAVGSGFRVSPASDAVTATGARNTETPTVTVAPTGNYGLSISASTSTTSVVPTYYRISVSPSPSTETANETRSYTQWGYGPYTTDANCAGYWGLPFAGSTAAAGNIYWDSQFYCSNYGWSPDGGMTVYGSYNNILNFSNGVVQYTTTSVVPTSNNNQGNTNATYSWSIPNSLWRQNDTNTRMAHIYVTPFYAGTGFGATVKVSQALGTTANSPAVTANSYASGTPTLNWTAPASDFTITGYNLQYSTDQTLLGATTISNINGTSRTITGLTSGTTYYYRVQAISAAGAGSWSNVKAFYPGATTPNSPPSPVATAVASSAGTVNVTIGQPSLSGGAPVTSFTLQYATDSGYTTGLQTITGISASATSYNVTGLTTGTAYYFRVAAVNEVGAGAYKQASGATAPISTVPAAPTALAVGNASGTYGRVTWTAPTVTGGGIDYYTLTPGAAGVMYFADGSSQAVATGTSSVNTPNTSTYAIFVPSVTVSGKTFTVSAHNGLGSGAVQSLSYSLTKTTVASTPAAATVSTGTLVGLNITGTAATGAAGYLVYISDSATIPANAAFMSTATPNVSGYTRTWLSGSSTYGTMTSGTNYYVWIKAINSFGLSGASSAVGKNAK